MSVHEYSIVRAILDRVEAEAAARGACGVASVTVRIGDAAGVERELLRTAWEAFRSASRLGEPELRVHGAPERWACGVCGRGIEPGRPLVCPECGYTLRMVSGDEILLERIELEIDKHEVSDVRDVRMR